MITNATTMARLMIERTTANAMPALEAAEPEMALANIPEADAEKEIGIILGIVLCLTKMYGLFVSSASSASST